MPKVNIQSIKTTWRGPYDAAIEYAVNDVVSYQGSSFGCDVSTVGNPPTDTSKWSKLNSASDLFELNPADNSILVYDGTEFQAVAPGNDGELLTSQGAGNPIFSSFSSDTVKEVFSRNVADATIGNINSGAIDTFEFTPSESGLIFVQWTFSYRCNPNSNYYVYNNLDFRYDASNYNSNIRWTGQGRAVSGTGDHLQTAHSSWTLPDAANSRAVAGVTQAFRLNHSGGGPANITNNPDPRMSWVVVIY